MRRPRAAIAVALALLALALMLAACGGDDDDEANTTPAPSGAPAPGGSGTPPSLEGLPPEFVECMAEQGYDVASSADIHAAPQQVLRTCFGSIH